MHPQATCASHRLPTFDEFLDHQLQQARWRHDALVKLQRLYDLNAQSVLMEAQMRDIEHFTDLTFNAPSIDRDDPLGLLNVPDREDRNDSGPDPDEP